MEKRGNGLLAVVIFVAIIIGVFIYAKKASYLNKTENKRIPASVGTVADTSQEKEADKDMDIQMETDDIIGTAKKMREAGDINGAIDFLEEVVNEKMPQDLGSHIILSEFYILKNEFDSAEKTLMKASKIQGADTDMWYHTVLADLYAAKNEYDKAEEVFTKIYGFELTNAEKGVLFLSWGRKYSRQGEYDKAIEKLKKAQTLEPQREDIKETLEEVNELKKSASAVKDQQ